MASPIYIVPTTHSPNPFDPATQLSIHMNEQTLALIASLFNNLSKISNSSLRASLDKTISNTFATKGVFETKVQRVLNELKEASIEDDIKRDLIRNLHDIKQAHDDQIKKFNLCVKAVKESDLSEEEKKDIIRFFQNAELYTRHENAKFIQQDVADQFIEVLNGKLTEKEELVKKINKLISGRSKNYDETKKIITYIDESSLCQEEKDKLIALMKQQRVFCTSMAKTTYASFIALLKDTNIQASVGKEGSVVYKNNLGMRFLQVTGGRYEIFYPEQYRDLLEGIRGKDGKRHGGLMKAAAMRAGVRDEYSIVEVLAESNCEALALKQGSLGYAENEPKVLSFKNVPSYIIESVIQQNAKTRAVSIGRELSKESIDKEKALLKEGKSMPEKDKTYDVVVNIGFTDEERKENYSDLVTMFTKAAVLSTSDYQMKKMSKISSEKRKLREAVTNMQSGYIVPLQKTSYTDTISGMQKTIYTADAYTHFSEAGIERKEYGETLAVPLRLRTKEDRENALLADIASGSNATGKVYVSDEEYTKAVLNKMPVIKNRLNEFEGKDQKEMVTYLSEKRTFLESRLSQNRYKEGSNGKWNDKRMLKEVMDYQRIFESADSFPSEVKLATVGVVMMETRDKIMQAKFKKDEQLENGYKLKLKEYSIAREAIVRGHGEPRTSDLKSALLAELISGKDFKSFPDIDTKDLINFTDYEFDQMKALDENIREEPSSVHPLTSEHFMEDVQHNLDVLKSTVQTVNEVQTRVSKEMAQPQNIGKDQSLSIQEGVAFRYAQHLIDNAVPDRADGTLDKDKLSMSETGRIIEGLHLDIDKRMDMAAQTLTDIRATEQQLEINSLEYSDVDFSPKAFLKTVEKEVEENTKEVLNERSSYSQER